MTLYDFSAINVQGETVSLGDYAGQVVLVVNTATRCGFTPQYRGLEALYKEFEADGFVILDFPCNQFAGQTPEDDAQVDTFCTETYHTTFPRFRKIDVNGEYAAPLYAWLRQQKTRDEGSEAVAFVEKIRGLNPLSEPGNILWNFTKFLIDRQGNAIHRYSPTVRPNELREVIAAETAKQ